jgi:hypothetical protein
MTSMLIAIHYLMTNQRGLRKVRVQRPHHSTRQQLRLYGRDQMPLPEQLDLLLLLLQEIWKGQIVGGLLLALEAPISPVLVEVGLQFRCSVGTEQLRKVDRLIQWNRHENGLHLPLVDFSVE